MQTDKIKYLVRELKKGKKEKFAEFYALTKSAVWYVIRSRMTDEHKAQDVMQESYVAYLNALDKVDESKNPLSYLITLAKNKTLDEYKKHRREDCVEAPEDYAGAETFYSPLADAPLLALCREKLKKEEYEILELTVIIGYKRVEVAKIMGKPVSTLNRMYHEILKKVKRLYKEAYDESR